MDKLMQFLDGFNIQTILSMALILWYFTRDIRNEIKKEIEAIKEEIQIIREENTIQSNRSDRLLYEQSKRSDRLYEMFIALLKEKK